MRPFRQFSLLFLLVCCLGFSACASKEAPAPQDNAPVATLDDSAFEDYGEEAEQAISDPLEPWNRFWFTFNDGFMLKIGKPLYQGYAAITPVELRSGLSNAYHNLKAPVRLVNSLLQGEVAKAWIELGRFMINSTVGFGGLIDVTKDKKPLVPVDPRDADFGQTLAKWGVGEGVYLVWPFLGPSTTRETVGMMGNWVASPLFWGSDPIGPLNLWVAEGLDVGFRFNNLGDDINTYESLTKSAVEPYVAMRDAYVKYRRAYGLPYKH